MGVMEWELVYARYNGGSAGRSSGELSPTEFPVLFLLYLDGSTGRLVKGVWGIVLTVVPRPFLSFHTPQYTREKVSNWK